MRDGCAVDQGPDGQDRTIHSLLGTLRKDGPERWLMRKLQRYTVNIHQRDAQRLQAEAAVEELIPGLFVQKSDVLYHADLGLLPDGADPAQVLIA